MRAVILAAGRGCRMGALTESRHKSLLEVGSRPLLGRIVDSLVEQGIGEIVVVTGYLSEQVERYLRAAYPKLAIEFVHNDEFATSNNSRSLALALNGNDDDVLVVESDLIYDPSVIGRVLGSPHDHVALVAPFANGMDGSLAHVVEGRLRSITSGSASGSKPGAGDVYKTVNIYKFGKSLVGSSLRPALEEHGCNGPREDYYETVLGSLIERGVADVYGEIVDDEAWAEVDDPNDLDRARFLFEPENRRTILERACGGHWNFPILDFTELRNMHFPTAEMHEALARRLPELVTQYGSSQRVLDEKLAHFLECSAEHAVLLNGLSQVYPLFEERLAGKRILIPHPTFGEYGRVFPDADRYEDRFGIDQAALADSVRGYDALVVVNPNNPTGTVVETSWIVELALAHPDLQVIVDESFIAFSSERSVRGEAETCGIENLVVLRSLSKELGVPGLRLGYLFSLNDAVARFVRKRTPIWNLGSVAEAFLELLLKHRDDYARSIEATLNDRARFSERLRQIPLVSHVYEGGGNFVVVKLDGPRNRLKDLPERLLNRWGVYVKDVSGRIGDGASYLRLAVRLPEENQRLEAALASEGRSARLP